MLAANWIMVKNGSVNYSQRTIRVNTLQWKRRYLAVAVDVEWRPIATLVRSTSKFLINIRLS